MVFSPQGLTVIAGQVPALHEAMPDKLSEVSLRVSAVNLN